MQPKEGHLQWYLECVQLMATHMVGCIDTEYNVLLAGSRWNMKVLDNGMCVCML
jgi:hypothetical protein